MLIVLLIAIIGCLLVLVIKLNRTFINGISKELPNNTGKTVWDIPGPWSIPILGTKWIFFHKYQISRLHEAYEDLNNKYGEIVREITPSGIPIVHLFRRQDIESVIRYPSRYPFRPPTEISVFHRKQHPEKYASFGITNEQGESWYNLKSKLTPPITSPKTLQAFFPVLNAICDDFIELLKFKRNPINNRVEQFENLANLIGLEAVCALMLGRRLGFLSIHENQPEYVKELATAVKQMFIMQRDSYYGLGLWKYLPTSTYKNYSKSEDIIYSIISKLVDQALQDEKLECSDDDLRSVFIKILQTEGLDIRDKKSAIIDFIAAGIETFANTLIFVLYYVSQHGKAKDSIFSEFERSGHGCIYQEDISSAIYTKACLQETYRIHPTAFCLARILEENKILSGYYVPAGTVVLCQTMIACRKNENFKDATTFRPERWLNNDKNSRTEIGASIVIPFGVGKRTCPGKRFVEMELLLLIAKMTLFFDVEFDEPLQTEFEFLLAPKTPVNLILKDREL